MKPLTRDQFQSAIARGLGRAYIHVRQFGDLNVQDILADACIHNLVYDTMCESSRADWILSIIDLTGCPEQYEREVLQQLPASESPDSDQMLDLAKQFAARGNMKAKEVVYEVFETQLRNGYSLGASQIIHLDGIPGFIHVAERIGERLGERELYLEELGFLEEAEQKFGADEVKKAIDERIRTSDGLRVYIELVRQELSVPKEPMSRERRREQIRKEYPLPVILELLEDGDGGNWWIFPSFGFFADSADVAEIYSRLCHETREPQLLRLLWVFGRRPMPKVTDGLILLARREDEIGRAARRALSFSSDARIHSLAREMMKDPDLDRAKDSLELFVKNLCDDDIGVIKDFLRRIPPSAGDFEAHNIGFDLNAICSANNGAALADILLWTYENTPCMNCGQTAVDLLIKSNSLPGVVLAECRCDGNEGLRQLVAGLRDQALVQAQGAGELQ